MHRSPLRRFHAPRSTLHAPRACRAASALFALWLTAFSAHAAHTHPRLILQADSARPGDTVLAGIELKMDSGWHTYWKNPGGPGIPTSVNWQLPPGVTAGDIQWPVPRKLPEPELDSASYIYEHDVVLLVPLKLSADLAPGPLMLKAGVKWLECESNCVPGSGNVQATLNIGPQPNASKAAGLIETWQKRLPLSDSNLAARAWWEQAPGGNSRPLILQWNSTNAASYADFFPDPSDQFEVQSATERLPSDAGQIRLRAQVKKLQGDWPKKISGVLIQKAGDTPLAYEASCPVADSGPAVGTAIAAGGLGLSLWKNLLYAFIGGLILNVMPCVLPVIALKILGFVREAQSDPGRVRKLGLIYALGVLVSFLILAGMVIGVKAAGHRAAWGMQFSSPQFVIFLIVLVTLVALNLFGIFEVNLSGQVMGAAGELASRQGTAGAFFNGMLATILATPCTAPILGWALGFAIAQSALIILLIFVTVAVGLAAPYVILSWEPAWLKFLPKPGAWMEKFKMFMGFPMLATAFWLFSLIPTYYGKQSWWLGIYLVLVALGAWVFGEFAQRGRSRKGLAVVCSLVLLIGGYLFAVEGQLKKIIQEWQPWSSEAVTQARADGHPVLVDFTADWCANCKIWNKPALESAVVQKKLKEFSAVALIADYTKFPANITDELNRFGAAGVPLVVVYPRNPAQPPKVFELVTPAKVVDALEWAAK